MRLFDRNSKLRSRLRTGRVLDEPKQMLPLLKGTLTKEDLPSFIIEPADADELRATLEFATERHIKIAVGAGLAPTSVRDLSGQLLLLTSRLSSSPIISTVRRTARVGGGFPAESLAIDLARDSMDWWPLWPVSQGKSVGALIAEGWEGVRNFRRGGTLAHVHQIEWMGYDGKSYSAGQGSPEAVIFPFGSRGAFGIITSMVLNLHPMMKSRSAALLEFPSPKEAALCMGELALREPQPETVLFWGKTAADIIRKGNDGTLSDLASCTVLAEWDEDYIRLQSPWDSCAAYYPTDSEVRRMWQDVLRMPRTAARLYAGRVEARVRLPLEAISALEETAADLGRDANLAIAIWGTVEIGYMHLWVMLSDNELITRTRARETLNKLLEIAVSLGAKRAAGDGGVSRMSFTTGSRYAERLRSLARERCDPGSMHVALDGD